jgi:hypothetical protein
MKGKNMRYLVFIVLIVVVIISTGCVSENTMTVNTPNQTPVPIEAKTIIPSTTSPVIQNTVRDNQTDLVETVILHDSGVLTTKTYKTYDFKDLGFDFVNPTDIDYFRISIKAEQPVLGYALNTEQVSLLGVSDQIPRYEPYSKKVQWGKLNTHYELEKVRNSTTTIDTFPPIPLTYVVDGRWMSFDSSFNNVPPFNYEITITRIVKSAPVNPNDLIKNNVIEYRDPVKIVKPEDLQIGDLIQRSIEDSLYEKNHGFIITNISSQNNQYLIQEIAKGQIIDLYGIRNHFTVVDYGKWFGIQPKSSRLITFGALTRDYPYKIGHASGPLPQIEYVIKK